MLADAAMRIGSVKYHNLQWALVAKYEAEATAKSKRLRLQASLSERLPKYVTPMIRLVYLSKRKKEGLKNLYCFPYWQETRTSYRS